MVEAGRHRADAHARKHHALIVEAGHQHLDALAFFPKDILVRHFAVFENQLSGIRPAHADLVEMRRCREPSHLFLDDKGRDPARPRLRVRLRVNDQRVGVRPVGDPVFRPVQHKAIVPLLGAELHRDDV